MDDVYIVSIKATNYEQHIDNGTDNDYCADVYNIRSKPNCKFASSINQRTEISKVMGSLGSVNKSDTPCEFFSDQIIDQLE